VTGLPFWAFWLAIGLGAGVLGGVAWLSMARNARTASHLAAFARGLAAGEPAQRPQVDQADRLHQLLNALDEVANRLRDAEEMQHQLEADRLAEVSQLSQILEMVKQAGRIAATSVAERDLLQDVVDEISMLQPRYRVGLYVLDDDKAWAVLRGEAGPQGQETWAFRQRVAIGDGTSVGQCLSSAEVRAWPDTTEGATHAQRAFQAGTRSDLAVPLCSHEQVLGALALSSDRVEVFEPQFVAAVQAVAQQTACALGNLRLRRGTVQPWSGASSAGTSTEQGWKELLRTRSDWGYRYEGGQIERVSGAWPPEMQEALLGNHVERGMAIEQKPASQPGKALAVPLQVRSQTVGVVGFWKPEGMPGWTTQEIQFVKLLVTQLGDALVGAQLYEAAQGDAARQQVVVELASRMRQTLDVEAVLRAAAEEMREALGLPEVVVRLRAPERAAAGSGDQLR
jgi:GAF domain-containing protein/HAMP domain-containing protein